MNLGLISRHGRQAADDDRRHLIHEQLSEVMRLHAFRIAANLALSILTYRTLVNDGQAGMPLAAWFIIGLGVFLLDLALFALMRRDSIWRGGLFGLYRSALLMNVVWGAYWAACMVMFYIGAASQTQLLLSILTTALLCTSPFILSSMPQGVVAFSAPLVAGTASTLLVDGASGHGFELSLIAAYVLLFPVALYRQSVVFRERVTALFRVREQNQIIKLFLNDLETQSSEWLWRTGARHEVIMLSPSFAARSGSKPDELALARLPEFLSANAADEPARVAARQFEARMHLGEAIRDAVIHLNLSGSDVWWSLTGTPAWSPDGAFTGYHGIARNVSDQIKAEQGLRMLALTDPLTGAANRAAFREEMARCAGLAKLRQERFAVALFDLDDFKAVNDTGGHAAGDEVLRESCRRITALLPEGSFIARMGGDEFAAVICLADTQDVSFAQSAVARVLDELALPILLPQGAFRVSASAGIACMPDCGIEAAAVMQLADEALYSAKNAGKGLVQVANERRNAASIRRKALEGDFARAVAESGLHLEFQPVIDSATGRAVMFEAFARWSHGEFGTVPPQEFMRIADRTGSHAEFGRWSIDAACTKLAGLPEEISIAVNVSSRLFGQPDFAGMVTGILRQRSVAPSRLVLEITESVYLAGVESVGGAVRRLQAAGIRIAIDDFGTGYSSLTSLCEVPFDTVKIDHELVRRSAGDPRARVILESIAAIGATLGISVSAEGVEDQAQADYLASLGCRYLQGWHFGAVMQADALNAWLLRQHKTQAAASIADAA